MFLILHAFSRRNSGDGLLVDLTLEALEAAGVDRSRCALLALDPESFPEWQNVYRAPGEPAARLSGKLAAAGWELVADRLSLGRVTGLARGADGFVAVGGGYLVADSPTRQLGVLSNHYVQLRTAARGAAPSIYLPQSIGPLQGPVGALAQRELRRIDRLYLRDDQSMAELGGPNARRCPDLAVMKLARVLGRGAETVAPEPRTVLVARDLPRAGDYLARLRSLAGLLTDSIWAVQADTEGPRSDRAFYRRLAFGDGGALSDLLVGGQPGTVVSVRLHGAIAALIAGRPAIHLAYERKGWGAYQDLGLADYVHDARRFDPQAVAAQARALNADPGPFWARIEKAAPRLRAHYEELVSDLRARLLG